MLPCCRFSPPLSLSHGHRLFQEQQLRQEVLQSARGKNTDHGHASKDRLGIAPRIPGSDFLFVHPALSADPVVREAFFESLSNPENRAREPWMLSALGYSHHPTRTRHSQRLSWEWTPS
jgi:hypothetical protein